MSLWMLSSQNMIVTIILLLALLSGGIPSAANAADVQRDYIDDLCEEDTQFIIQIPDRVCDDLKQLRNSQAVAAVSIFNT